MIIQSKLRAVAHYLDNIEFFFYEGSNFFTSYFYFQNTFSLIIKFKKKAKEAKARQDALDDEEKEAIKVADKKFKEL